MVIKVLFVTGNQNKLSEVKQILGNRFQVENIDIDVPEIQSTSVQEVTTEKLEHAYKVASEQYGKEINIICEDTGLHFDNMNDFPGALIKFYYKAIGNEGIVKHNGGSKAKAVTIVGLKNKEGTFLFQGEKKGKVVKKLTTFSGFGWDPIFVPTKYESYKNQTYAEIPLDIKNKVSQRYKAFTKFKKHFKSHQ